MESCNTESSLDLPLESLSLQPFLQSLHKEQWQEVRLGEVAEIISGGTPKTSIPEYWNGEIPWLTPKDLAGYNHIYISKGERFITKLGLKNSSATLMPKGTILLSSRAPIGYVAIAQNDICTNQGFKSLIVNPKQACNLFVYYWIKDNVKYLQSLGTGTTFEEISKGVVQDITIPLPPLTIQQKIAEILSSFDDKIDLLHRQNKTLESLALTLFRHYFIDNPKRNEWEEKPLSEVCQIKNGFAFKSEEYKKIGIPVVRTTNFKNGFVENHNLVYLDENDKNKYSKYLLQVNDFLLVMVGASLGKYAIVTSEILPALQNQNMWNFRVLGSVSQYYLNYAMQEIIANNINTASGSAREFFQKSYFYKIPILIPPKNIMMKFHTQMDNFYHKTTNNRKQIQNLQAMRDMLLKAIFA
ncbi:hypothetical protein C826_01322 [Helicobacter bilis WiWa]|uniref:Type I restriction modification DNA specificity domain-containing protein n=4 Tax=Helicobacter bilis TaxID=37372 RepID=N2BPS1_9HELI|nr:restriction endonuclease subunit S [Helicobacter bilis]EMZ38899.1 hypothetical protein C826_01322 [Helicobacter bilis WiWa]